MTNFKTMDLATTKSKATAFSRSYGAAMELKLRQSSASNRDVARALTSHYNPAGFVSFALGGKLELRGGGDAPVDAVTYHLDNMVQHGVGVDVRLEAVRVEPVAPGTALCWLTWTLYPPADSGVEGWSYENVYSYRQPMLPDGEPSGKEYWEFVVSDNELAELLKRFPDFIPRNGAYEEWAK